jgi:hypothetical protein
MSKNTCFSRTNRHHAEQPATIISVQYSHVDDPKCPDSITRTYRCTATAVPSLICRRVARASHASCSHHSRPDGQRGWDGETNRSSSPLACARRPDTVRIQSNSAGAMHGVVSSVEPRLAGREAGGGGRGVVAANFAPGV